MSERTILCVMPWGASAILFAGDKMLAMYPDRETAINRAMDMVKRWPEEYEICVEDPGRDYAQQHQGKRRDQVEFSVAAVTVLAGIGLGFYLGLLFSEWFLKP